MPPSIFGEAGKLDYIWSREVKTASTEKFLAHARACEYLLQGLPGIVLFTDLAVDELWISLVPSF